jgi:hypothetical protein
MHFVSQITLPPSDASRVTVTRVFQQPAAKEPWQEEDPRAGREPSKAIKETRERLEEKRPCHPEWRICGLGEFGLLSDLP